MNRICLTGRAGLNLVADVGGDPRQQPVILLHGGGQTRHSWRSAARQLVASGYQVINLDQRGHGESGRAPDGDYSLDAFVADLKAVSATLGQPPVLIGASLGGAAALLAAGEAKALEVRALVLVDVVARMAPQGVEHIRHFMQRTLGGFATLDEAAIAIARYTPGRTQPPSTAGLLRNLSRKENGRYHWHWDPAFLQDESRSASEPFARRLEAAAVAVRAPTLLVRGAQSNVVTEEGARSLLKLIPHAERLDVDGAGHMVAGDRNDAFNSAILAFLVKALA
ncbi:alpha/beta fold hydrolase [Pseudomonas typographi]|uniref:alpha/beta fold hydrolase n=1 Tax=Pseudomonas typographi TaxID=2715964 RepID=UPI0016843F23|nr:alpha/beta fold hydrolase [Pseudomonas typographi]MBD1587498.1 alpha/beta hydrolase [Pseudomonas typographi]